MGTPCVRLGWIYGGFEATPALPEAKALFEEAHKYDLPELQFHLSRGVMAGCQVQEQWVGLQVDILCHQLLTAEHVGLYSYTELIWQGASMPLY